jgi:hypothetical protein
MPVQYGEDAEHVFVDHHVVQPGIHEQIVEACKGGPAEPGEVVECQEDTTIHIGHEVEQEGESLPLRSQQWWDSPANPDMTALYLERYLTLRTAAQRVRAGVRDSGGIAREFPGRLVPAAAVLAGDRAEGVSRPCR